MNVFVFTYQDCFAIKLLQVEKVSPHKRSLLYSVPFNELTCFITAMGVPVYKKPLPKYGAHDILKIY